MVLPDLINPERRYPKKKCETVTYTENDNDEEAPLKKRKPLEKLKGPSSRRIAAVAMPKRIEPKVKPVSTVKGKQREPEEDVDNINGDENIPDTPNIIIKPSTSGKHATKKGEFNSEFHGLELCKKPRKFTCSSCSVQKDSLAKINKHYMLKHPPVTCQTCSKAFNTPSSLARHKYIHGNLQYKCNKDGCNKIFAFASELTKHSIMHRTQATFKCYYGDCDRLYYSKEELVKHVCIHDGKTWSCKEAGCPYKTHDKRLLHQHKRKHSPKKPYVCGLCGDDFRYHTQYSRHVNRDECEKRVQAVELLNSIAIG